MSLHNGIDTVSVATFGVFSETYGSTDDGNIAKLHVSRGLIESDITAVPEVDRSGQVGLLLKVY